MIRHRAIPSNFRADRALGLPGDRHFSATQALNLTGTYLEITQDALPIHAACKSQV